MLFSLLSGSAISTDESRRHYKSKQFPHINPSLRYTSFWVMTLESNGAQRCGRFSTLMERGTSLYHLWNSLVNMEIGHQERQSWIGRNWSWLQAVQRLVNLPMILLSTDSSIGKRLIAVGKIDYLHVVLLNIHSSTRRRMILLWLTDSWTSSIRTKA